MAINLSIFNDTGNYPHIGCKAVSDANDSQFDSLGIHVRYRHYVGEFSHIWNGSLADSILRFSRSELIHEILSVDAVLVNGEGTIHHGFGMHLIAILAGAQELGKPTYLINSVLQDVPDEGFEVLRKLNDLTVRDAYSYEYLCSKGIACRLVPDSIMMARFHDKDDPSFEGKIVVTDCVANRTDVRQQLELVLKHYGADAVYFPLEGVNSDCWQRSLKLISGARLVVTGRHHGLYLALMAKRPFVALPSNTWKIEGTLAAIGGEEWLWSQDMNLLSLCEKALKDGGAFASIFESDFLKNPQAAFDTLVRDFSLVCNEPHSRDGVVGTVSCDLSGFVDKVLLACGLGNVLNIVCGKSVIAREFYKRGVDASELDVSALAARCCHTLSTGQCSSTSSALDLPFDDNSFQTIVSTDGLENIAFTDVLNVLQEIYRVTKRFAVLNIAVNTRSDVDCSMNVGNRAWWEVKCFEAGFRKHPAYCTINNYESLNKDSDHIVILLEKISSEAVRAYPLASLNEERGLHVDMTRDSGEQSDAHIIRYQWACDYIKPGDRVLDAACGLGYGSYIVSYLTRAEQVVGIDGSDYAIGYAKMVFHDAKKKMEYRHGMLLDILSEYPAASFDAIISFEALAHVDEPEMLLQEYYRLLRPGGRVIVSVPNDWSDETSEDPNPYHLQVYDWNRLKSELSVRFMLEDAYTQTASQCKVSARNGAWERRPRSLKQVNLSEHQSLDCEWWLMTAMKSPLDGGVPYQEKVFANISCSGHPSIRYSESYQNPWLMHAMVNSEYRLKNSDALDSLVDVVLDSASISSNDYAAALCVKAYRFLNGHANSTDGTQDLLAKIDSFTTLPDPEPEPMRLRWRVSLLFVRARIFQFVGDLERAKATFIACAEVDVRKFGIHLATKTTEAFYLAGRIALSLGNWGEAQQHWRRGIDYGGVLLGVSLDDVLINRDFPNLFNHGDGIREYTVAWDNVARCANGIHLLKFGSYPDLFALDNCHQTEYGGVTRDLISVRQDLVERTRRLERADVDLRAITKELVETRQAVVDRTKELVDTRKTLVERTEELVDTRQTLVDRTERLEQADRILNEQAKMLQQMTHESEMIRSSWFYRFLFRSR